MNGATSALQALGFSPEDNPTDSKTANGKNIKEYYATGDKPKDDHIRNENVNKEDNKENINTEDRISISESFQAPPLIVRRTFAKARLQPQSRLSRFMGPLFLRHSKPKDEESIAEVGADTIEAVLPEKGDTLDRDDIGGDGRRNVREERRRLLVGILPPWLARFTGTRQEEPRNQEEVAIEPEIDEEEEGTELITLRPIDNPLFSSVVPRGPMMKYDLFSSLDNIPFIAKQLAGTNSTATDLAQWLQHEEHQRIHQWTRLGPLNLLFNIIHQDIMEVVHLMNLALSEISYDILDDSTIQQRLLHWRHLLDRFERELSQLQDSLQAFATFLLPPPIPRSAHPDKDSEDNPINSQLKASLKQISDLRQRTTKSYKSLTANISIVESKRGIAEAESVTKLTELAFLFIPLTFSASIFSMQVKELNAANISISAFFVLAIIITTSSYGLRLFIRSDSVIKFRKHVVEQVRIDAELPPGAAIPTRSFLIWVLHRFELLIVPTSFIVMTIAIAGIALLVAPLAVLWARHTDRGYKAVISLLILIFGLTSAYFVVTAVIHRDTRGVHLRRDIFKYSRGYERYDPGNTLLWPLSKAFSWIFSAGTVVFLVATALAAAPLIAIWTRQLEKGIKVSVTLSIVVIYLVLLSSFAISFGIKRGVSTFRNRRYDSDLGSDY